MRRRAACCRLDWVLVLLLGLIAVACENEQATRTTEAQVVRCEMAVESAIQNADPVAGEHTFFAECAYVYVEPQCRDAFAKTPDIEERRLPYVVEACRQAYCAKLEGEGLALCMGGSLEDGPDLLREWGVMNAAIISHDAGKRAPRVMKAMVRYFAHSARAE